MPTPRTEAIMAQGPDDRRRGVRTTALIVAAIAVAVYMAFVLSAMR